MSVIKSMEGLVINTSYMYLLLRSVVINTEGVCVCEERHRLTCTYL